MAETLLGTADAEKGGQTIDVRTCMTRNPITVHPLTRLGEAMGLMTRHHLRHLPVIGRDRAFVGGVKEVDVRAALSWYGRKVLERGVLSLTFPGAPSLTGDTSVEDAWIYLNRAPVEDPLSIVTDGKLEGTLTLYALARALGGLSRGDVGEIRATRDALEEWASRSSPFTPRISHLDNLKQTTVGGSLGDGYAVSDQALNGDHRRSVDGATGFRMRPQSVDTGKWSLGACS